MNNENKRCLRKEVTTCLDIIRQGSSEIFSFFQKGNAEKRRKKTMKKAGFIILVLVILGGWTVKGSEAEQWCWKSTEISQYIKLSVVKPDPSYPFWSLNGITYVPNMVVIPVGGTMVKSADGTERLLVLFGGINGNVLEMDAAIDTVTKNGTVGILGISPPIARETFTIEKVSCSSLPKP